MSKRDSLLYLNKADLSHLDITPVEMADELEALISACATGAAWNLPKTAVTPDDNRLFMSTLAIADSSGLTSCKALGLNHRNASRGIDHINALVTLFDSDTGEPIAIMDGNWITAVRTAAVSAVAARHLGRKSSSSIAFIGCGVQALTHFDAFHAIFDLTDIRAFGRGQTNLDKLCAHATAMGVKATACNNARTAVEGADLVVTTVPDSPGFEPFLDAGWLVPGAFVAMVDLSRSWYPRGLATFDKIFIEDLRQERTMTPPMLDLTMVSGDLNDLVTGARPGRENENQRLGFAFRGLAVGDLALASLAYRAAVAQSKGTQLPR